MLETAQAGVRITAQSHFSRRHLSWRTQFFPGQERTSHKAKAPNHSLYLTYRRVERLLASWTLGVFVQYPLLQLDLVSLFPTDRLRLYPSYTDTLGIIQV